MDEQEARSIRDKVLGELRGLSYEELRKYLHAETRQLKGPSGKEYQVEITSMWDDRPKGNLRVAVSIDDYGWRAIFPKKADTADFIISPEGKFVGE